MMSQGPSGGNILFHLILPCLCYLSYLFFYKVGSNEQIVEAPVRSPPPAMSPTGMDVEINHLDHQSNMHESSGIIPSDIDYRDALKGLRVVIHRNGEANPCGDVSWQDLDERIASAISDDNDYLSKYDKYEFESFLTMAIAGVAGVGRVSSPLHANCGPEKVPPEIRGKRNRRVWKIKRKKHLKRAPLFLQYCDMGERRTPILPNHGSLISVQYGPGRKRSLPCHFHTREGLPITSFKDLIKLATDLPLKVLNEQSDYSDKDYSDKNTGDGTSNRKFCQGKRIFHIYSVPAGRNFMFAPSYIGETFDLDHISTDAGKPVSLKVLSISPRIFDIINFFEPSEANEVVQGAVEQKSEVYKMKRSSTGVAGYSVNSQRTSDNGFDTHGKTAKKLKRRCMKTLGFDEYTESFTDGLQILRYNKTTAYIPHMDYIDDPLQKEVHNYDASGKGTNRFATILLYMTDLEEYAGGETVFVKAPPHDVPEDLRLTKQEALQQVRSNPDLTSFLRKGSWQETMVADCRTKLAVVPHSSRSVLFYSQHPNGVEDTSSEHGGCPVLKGTKWAANLWVWNGIRGGFAGSPVNQNVVDEKQRENGGKPIKPDGEVQARFTNTGRDPIFKDANLYYEDTFWMDFSHGSVDIEVNTYHGHRWNVKAKQKDKILKEIVIDTSNGNPKYEFTV